MIDTGRGFLSFLMKYTGANLDSQDFWTTPISTKPSNSSKWNPYIWGFAEKIIIHPNFINEANSWKGKS